jgi:hypothetical protein
VLDLISKPLVVVLKITKPVAADAMASLCVVVILGGKNPLVVELTSSIAEALAVLPSALIRTDCAVAATVVKIVSKINSFFIMVCFILFQKRGLRPIVFSKGQTCLPAGRQSTPMSRGQRAKPAYRQAGGINP